MRSEAATVEEYLASLPEERRQAIDSVRDVVLANLPDGYEETMNWGMIAYEVPLATYPDTYNKRPLMYAALASQKNYMSLYLTSVYALPGAAEEFERAYRATGKRYDMGKSCVRFRRLDDLPLELVAQTIAAVDVPSFIQRFEEGLQRRSC
jgi:uncharacterized protein YdhG (YjbR/CyaY superfamily)